jgi:hypothetical protein
MILLPHLAAKVLEKFDHNTMQIGQSRYYRRALFAGDLCAGVGVNNLADSSKNSFLNQLLQA